MRRIDKRIDGFLRRLYTYGFTTRLLTFQQLHRNANATLFKKIFNSDHCLHHLLPPVKSLPMQQRPGRRKLIVSCQYVNRLLLNDHVLQDVCLLIMIKDTFIAFICFIF